MLNLVRKLPLLLGALLLSATSVYPESNYNSTGTPAFVSGAIIHTRYDGVSNDLLTAGLGKSGLAKQTGPGFNDPKNPTAEELRSRAIYTNYRAIVDTSAGGGYGVFFGPN